MIRNRTQSGREGRWPVVRWSRARVRILLAMVSVASIAWIAAAQQPAGQSTLPPVFTGEVDRRDSSDVRVSRLRFEAGARTHWHVHGLDQVLLAEEGRGLFHSRGGGAMTPLVPGQPVFAPGGVEHWHGAEPDQYMLQLTMYGGELTWMQPVTDEEYLGQN